MALNDAQRKVLIAAERIYTAYGMSLSPDMNQNYQARWHRPPPGSPVDWRGWLDLWASGWDDWHRSMNYSCHPIAMMLDGVCDASDLLRPWKGDDRLLIYPEFCGLVEAWNRAGLPVDGEDGQDGEEDNAGPFSPGCFGVPSDRLPAGRRFNLAGWKRQWELHPECRPENWQAHLDHFPNPPPDEEEEPPDDPPPPPPPPPPPDTSVEQRVGELEAMALESVAGTDFGVVLDGVVASGLFAAVAGAAVRLYRKVMEVTP